MLTDHLSGIAAFVEAARAGSFTLAAERMGLTKSAVGKSVSRLETRLGVKLFYRTTRKLSLTVDGEAFLASCKTALNEIIEAEAALKSEQGVPKGRVRIDMPAAYGRKILLPVLLEIASANPGLQLTLTFSDRLIDPVEEGVDLVIRFGILTDSAGLVSRRLMQQTLHVCASPTYLSRRGHPRTVEELRQHDCIVGFRRGTPLQWDFLDESGGTFRFSPPSTHEVGDGDAIIAAALAGLGLCQMPSSLVAEHLRTGDLVAILQDTAAVSVNVHALWPGSRHLSAKVRYIVDALVMEARAGRLG